MRSENFGNVQMSVKNEYHLYFLLIDKGIKKDFAYFISFTLHHLT